MEHIDPSSPLERFYVALNFPAIDTNAFHKLYAELLISIDIPGEVFDQIDGMLHIPTCGPVEWEDYAIELAKRGLIPTVTAEEALGAYKPREDNQAWGVLSARVLERRRIDHVERLRKAYHL